uniref:Anaphase-promoting complex subunit 4 WD40 domain-containing protein n=1 Tax=Globisporangium ultimum (strain ATCC 200006 / CBS 805.95 / DAOM BR144) TaxID=431595 RepID=K3X853_GLOUD
MLRIVAGTYEGLLYGWEFPTKASLKAPSPKLKLIFGYSAHTECIKSVALMAAKHGKTLLSGGNDEMIKIYNVDKRVEVGSLMEQHGAITSLEFFGQSHLLSGSADNSICIWRTSDWNCLHILGGHKGEINSIAVHPSGKLCFSVARDRTLRMWNLVKGRIAYIRRLEREANLVMLSQKGTRYALCFGTDLSVFSSANAELVGTLEHKQRIQCAVFATDDYVVCGGDDKYIYVWKTSGSLVAKVTHPEITARIRCMQVLYVNGEDQLPWIVIATSNGAVQIWDLATLKFDALAPEESNKSVVPVASTLLLSKPRLTCLTACLADEDIAMPAPKKEKKIAKKAATKPATTKAEMAAAPRVVVELDDEKPDTKQQKKAPDTKQQQQKRKTSDNKQQQKQGKKKAKKQQH